MAIHIFVVSFPLLSAIIPLVHLIEVNECTVGTHNCDRTNGICINKSAGFTCVCKPGFTGNGVACTDIDECTVGKHTCDRTNGICTNTPGTFSCSCKTGFTGNGMTCTDIDECRPTARTDNCDRTNGVCTNTPVGSFTCSCKTGFTENGVSCTRAPPGTPQMTGFPSGPVITGTQVNLKCVASPPGDTYDWYKDGTKVTTSLAYDFQVTKASAGVYKCVAINSAGSATSCDKTLVVYYIADSVVMSSGKTSAHVGEKDKFTCTVSGGNPTPTLKIYFKRSGGTPVEVIQGQDRVMAKEDNQAEYYCEAKVTGYPALDMTSSRKTYSVTPARNIPNFTITRNGKLVTLAFGPLIKGFTRFRLRFCGPDQATKCSGAFYYISDPAKTNYTIHVTHETTIYVFYLDLYDGDDVVYSSGPVQSEHAGQTTTTPAGSEPYLIAISVVLAIVILILVAVVVVVVVVLHSSDPVRSQHAGQTTTTVTSTAMPAGSGSNGGMIIAISVVLAIVIIILVAVVVVVVVVLHSSGPVRSQNAGQTTTTTTTTAIPVGSESNGGMIASMVLAVVIPIALVVLVVVVVLQRRNTACFAGKNKPKGANQDDERTGTTPPQSNVLPESFYMNVDNRAFEGDGTNLQEAVYENDHKQQPVKGGDENAYDEMKNLYADLNITADVIADQTYAELK